MLLVVWSGASVCTAVLFHCVLGMQASFLRPCLWCWRYKVPPGVMNCLRSWAGHTVLFGMWRGLDGIGWDGMKYLGLYNLIPITIILNHYIDIVIVPDEMR